ncbi:hypothetical protein K438DRAFT_1999970 [Mycena galopus ATCC 62051]|nr:hypothetical protein K438DRAFT_1999970 [Mycena galopus ATCC 62051]
MDFSKARSSAPPSTTLAACTDVGKTRTTGSFYNLLAFIEGISIATSQEDIGVPLLAHGILTALLRLVRVSDLRVIVPQELLNPYLAMLERLVVVEPDLNGLWKRCPNAISCATQAAAQGERLQELARVRAVAAELIREISRKAAKIQDAGLSDYELRDIHDEINKQMREKRYWTNYRRNVAMLDDDGKEDKRGQPLATEASASRIKRAKPGPLIIVRSSDKSAPARRVAANNFGCAKELFCVREFFQSRKTAKEEANTALAF